MIAQSDLDALWDFDDAVGSERRLREAAALTYGTDAAELLTQAARALGLQSRFDDAEAVLRSIADDAPVVRTRIALEQGRILNSAGRPAESVSHFESAERLAADNGLDFPRVDALHMLGIAEPDRAGAHTQAALRALDGLTDARTLRWSVSLHNNLGWSLFDDGRLDDALAEFEEALRAAESVGTEAQRGWAVEAIDECRQAIAERDAVTGTS